MTPALCDTLEFARRIRCHALRMVHRVDASHIGSSLSIADLLAVLYSEILRIDPARPERPERDRLVLSKGHAAAGFYAALAERGFFPTERLGTFCRDGSTLAGHLSSHGVPGVDFSTGSLGHGLPVACGMALAGNRGRTAHRIFALLSDGECDEGSTWEAALFAPHHHLENLVAIIDYNTIQSFGTVQEVLDLEPLTDKWRACGWAVREIDGHDHGQIRATLAELPFEPRRPSVVVAHTIKGRGVSFMEGTLAWHYQSPTAEQLAAALAELGEPA